MSRFVVVRRAVAVGVVLGFLGLVAGFGGLAGFEGQAGQEVVDLGLVEAVLAAVGDSQGVFSETPGLGAVATPVMPARPGQQDGGFELDQVDAAAADESFVEVGLGGDRLTEVRVGPAQQPLGPNDVALAIRGVAEAAGLPGGYQGGFGVASEDSNQAAVRPNHALALAPALGVQRA